MKAAIKNNNEPQALDNLIARVWFVLPPCGQMFGRSRLNHLRGRTDNKCDMRLQLQHCREAVFMSQRVEPVSVRWEPVDYVTKTDRSFHTDRIEILVPLCQEHGSATFGRGLRL